MTTVDTTGSASSTKLDYLEYYREQVEHQRAHTGLGPRLRLDSPGAQPSRWCIGCSRDGVSSDPVLRYSWAIPSHQALEVIAAHSPSGVVEIGAGGGYWAYELQRHGVDVVAYDPDPLGLGERPWHDGRPWTAVHEGDHTAAAEHPDRTLLIVWPTYDDPWAARALDIFRGDTMIYVGEGDGGCTATHEFHQLIDDVGPLCWHTTDQCDCPPARKQRWRQVDDVQIPQWWGIHDRLSVFTRIVEPVQTLDQGGDQQ